VDAIEMAMKLAKEASVHKMMMHCNYMGVPMLDEDSNNELTEKEIRALYREEAAKHPEKFMQSYGDKTIEIKYYINKSLETGLIHNKATWGSSNSEICDISGLRSQEGIAEKLFEFSQSEAGNDFLVQLKALYN
jgi:hypothetical protein